MPNIAVCGFLGTGKTTSILEHFQRFKGKKFYCTYPNKTKDLAAFKAAGAKCFTEFGEFLYHVLKNPGCLAAADESDDLFPEKKPESKQRWKEGKVVFISHPTIQLLSTTRSDGTFLYIILHAIKFMHPWMVMYLNGMNRFNTNDQLDIQMRRFQECWPELVKNLKKYKKIPPFKSHFIPTPS